MAQIYSDRSIQHVASTATRSNIGRLAVQRLKKNAIEIERWYQTLQRINVGSSLSSTMHFVIARNIERHLGLLDGSVTLEDKDFSTYRKRTKLTIAYHFDSPWAIIKTYSDPAPGHSLLRGYREARGCQEFSAIKGVLAPQNIFAFALHGKGAPNYLVIIGESYLYGSSLLNWLESGAKKEGTTRKEFHDEALNVAEKCGQVLCRVHTNSCGKVDDVFSADVETLENEGVEAASLLEINKIIGACEAKNIRATLRRERHFLPFFKPVVSHRDYTTNNLVYVESNGAVGVIDLEKSEVEFPGKDIAKFTESLLIDGTNIGLTLAEIESMRNAFLRGYFAEETCPNLSGFWRMIKFYQIYTILSFIRYNQADLHRTAILKQRMNALTSQI